MVVTNNLPDNAIILSMFGRMGNNLFEIANGYCLSRETNRPFYLHLIDPITKELKHDALDIINRFDCIYDAKLAEGSVLIEQPLNQEFFDAKKYISDTKKKYYIAGYFQDEMYFKKYEKEIKNLFYCPEFLKNMIYEKYGNLFDYVSITVRRGDYVKLGNLVPDDYYEKAYHQFFEGRKCIIISDDIEWCKKNIHIQNAVFCEKCENKEYSALFDFYCGVFCRDHIITNSTFSWWQAYLGDYGNSLIIAPYKWYICKYWEGVKAEIVPKRWVKFDSDTLISH